MSLVVTISGPMGSGKTVLMGAIRELLSSEGMQVRCIDDGHKAEGLSALIPAGFYGKKVLITTELKD